MKTLYNKLHIFEQHSLPEYMFSLWALAAKKRWTTTIRM